MGDRLDNTYSIDRIDNNGNYAIGNVRWATRSEQQRNTNVRKISTTGIRFIHIRQPHGYHKARYITRHPLTKKYLYSGYDFDMAKERLQQYYEETRLDKTSTN